MKERLNWREACEVLGCSKSTLYRLVANGQLRAFGVGSRGRWYSRTECERFVLDRCKSVGGRWPLWRAARELDTYPLAAYGKSIT